MNYYDHERDERWRDRAELVTRKPYCDHLPPRDPTLWKDFSGYLVSRNLSQYIARANHWYPSRDAGDNLPRIVMPASSDQEGNHFWQARYMGSDPDIKRYQSPYGRTGDAAIIVYPQKGVNEPLVETVVVEGPMCALAVAGTGRMGLATMGADPPEERLDLIFKRIYGTICTVVPDSDRQDLFIHVFTYLSNRGIQCRWLVPGPSAKDFAEMSPENRMRFF